MLSRLRSSAFFFCVLIGAAGLWLHGCEGSVGPCSGSDCPTVPGCEGDSNVVCGPSQVCEDRVCEGVGWICGVDDSGNYAWLRSAAPCSDNNPCTVNDICSAGSCWGTAKECKKPPATTCTDGVTLKTFDSKGKCSGGICSYSSSTLKCPGKCSNGKCEGAPCVGIKCDNPPAECYKSPGTCLAGKCTYVPQNKGTACGSKNKCSTSATCDGAGKCVVGQTMNCTRANTTGGTCVAGSCQGFQCTSGYGNCNNSWTDGCEVSLASTSHCGKCNANCGSIPHATAKCSGGKCIIGSCSSSYKDCDGKYSTGCEALLTSTSHCGKCNNKCGSVAHGKPACSGGKCVVGSCSSPYKDCDRKFSNGCELPEGVANGCSKSGLTYAGSGTPSGCGTPWCGNKSGGTTVKKFSTWTCVFCTKCHYFPDGWSWCLSSGSNSGKFSSARCASCCNNSYKDKVCK